MDITEFERNKTSQRHPWEKARVRIIKNLIRKHHPHCQHILDVGSGDVYLLNELCKNKIGEQYTAIDNAYTPELINKLQSGCMINFFGQLPAALVPKADCVLLLDVLEHCEDDGAVLKSLKDSALINGPIFFITVPAYQSLFSQHDIILNHYRRYSGKQLTSLCQQNNFEVIHAGYFFSSLLMIRSLLTIAEKAGITKAKKSIDNWSRGTFITNALEKLLWFDFLIGSLFAKCRIQLPGLSTYCICRPLL